MHRSDSKYSWHKVIISATEMNFLMHLIVYNQVAVLESMIYAQFDGRL